MKVGFDFSVDVYLELKKPFPRVEGEGKGI